MRVVVLVAIFLAAALAGCTEDAPEPQTPVGAAPTFELSGILRHADGRPAFGVELLAAPLADPSAVASQNLTEQDGSFVLGGLPNGTYVVRVDVDGTPRELAEVEVPGGPISLQLPARAPVAYVDSWAFQGFLECALEAIIISPSCDTIVQFAGQDALFVDESVFELEAGDAWATIVLDLAFDPAAHPGIDGMRVSAYADGADAEVLEYERITQAAAPGPFTLRIEPGVDYGDAVPAPDVASGFRFEFFPHGHGDDTICTPDGTCFLGIGTTARLEFEAIVSIFYHEAAPDGWTLLG